MLGKKTFSRLAGGAAISLCLSAAVASGAAHADPPPAPTVTETVYSATQVTAGIVANVTNSLLTATVDALQFVLDQALTGRVVDISAVKTSVLPNLTLVWENSTDIGNAFVETATNPSDPTDVAQAAGFETTDNSNDASVVGEATGTGMTAHFNGAEYTSGACYTASMDKGKMTYCGIKYRITESNPNLNLYFYDRYATATGKVVNNASDFDPVKIDLRTRPNASGSNINAMLDYGPRGAVTSCSQTATLGVSGFGFSATIPFSECSDVTGYPDGKTMRVVYDQGGNYSGRVHSVEMGVVYRTPAGVTANAAHYNYTKFCGGFWGTCGSLTKTSAGW